MNIEYSEIEIPAYFHDDLALAESIQAALIGESKISQNTLIYDPIEPTTTYTPVYLTTKTESELKLPIYKENENADGEKTKPFKCKECGKGFRAASYLRIHMLVHTKEKPHKCTRCGARFTQDSSLKTHLKNKSCFKRPPSHDSSSLGEEKDKQQLMACENCGSMLNKNDLKVHMKERACETVSFRCDECLHLNINTKFFLEADLQNHKKSFHSSGELVFNERKEYKEDMDNNQHSSGEFLVRAA